MFRTLSFIGVYKQARKFHDFYELCDSKTDKDLTWLISQLSHTEYEKLRETLDRIYEPTEPDAIRDMCEDLAQDLNIRFREARDWLQNYARKSITPSYIPTAEDLMIPTQHWEKFEKVAKQYAIPYIDHLVEIEKVKRIKKLFREYDSTLKVTPDYFFK